MFYVLKQFAFGKTIDKIIAFRNNLFKTCYLFFINTIIGKKIVRFYDLEFILIRPLRIRKIIHQTCISNCRSPVMPEIIVKLGTFRVLAFQLYPAVCQ